MTRGQSFNVGETVTVLTDDGFVFIGNIVACEAEFECKCCEENNRKKFHEEKEEEEEEENEVCQTFLVLSLEEDVEDEKHKNDLRKDVIFREGQLVFINFCQIIAIAAGFPPEEKKTPS